MKLSSSESLLPARSSSKKKFGLPFWKVSISA